MTYVRPRTRGELRDRLSNGETLEVASDNAELTTMMLKHWLRFTGFTTRLGPNQGWTLFEPGGDL